MTAAPRTSTHHRLERGFTMIEMIVVLVLIGLASASIFPAITSMMRSSTRSAALTSSSGDGRIAERIAEHDIRGASAARSNGDRSDLGTSDSSVVDALNSTLPARHDILEANATRLRLWTEVLRSSAGPEDVTWELRENVDTCGSAAPNWCVVRTVRPTTGTPISEVVTRGRKAFPASIPNNPCGNGKRLFCYRTSTARSFRWNNNWNNKVCNTATAGSCAGAPRPNCEIAWANLTSTFGAGGWVNNVQHNGFDGAVQLHQLDLITSIVVILPSGGGFGATSERTFSTTELTIRARQGEAYQRAIMCGGR